jgi:hypothetical protein
MHQPKRRGDLSVNFGAQYPRFSLFFIAELCYIRSDRRVEKCANMFLLVIFPYPSSSLNTEMHFDHSCSIQST